MRLLTYDFMRQALVAATIVCGVAPLVGTFVVQRRQSLVGDGMGHVAFAGVGLAFVTGVAPLAGALLLTLIAAWLLVRLQRGGLGGDLSLALLFYGGIALGYVFAHRSGAGLNQLLGFLFGSPLDLTWGEVAAIVGIAVTVLVIVLMLYRTMLAVAFDEQAARVTGVPVDALVLGLTLLVALVVVGGMHTIGLLLIAAMMVVPVAAASRLTASYRSTMLLSAAFGAVSAVAGLVVAFYADTAPGATIILSAIALYIVAAAVPTIRRLRTP